MNLRTIIVPLLLLFIGISACSVSKQGMKERRSINGHWVLQTATIEGIEGKVSTKVLNEASLNCFVGSQWNFVNNNSLGDYSLSAATEGCSPLKRNFRWSVVDGAENAPKILQYKRLDDNRNELDANDGGFRFTIIELTSNSMVLKNDISFEGKPASFIYKFAR